MIDGVQLRAEREAAGVRAKDVAAVWRQDPAMVTRIEQREDVDALTVKRYRRAVEALVEQRRTAARRLIRQLEEVAAR